jgi:hypothetical protein
MKKITVAVLALFLISTQSAAAMCTWGVFPQEREYEPLDATEAFISYADGVQTLVLQAEWKGDVTDFTIVYPTPSKPEVEAGPEQIFTELDAVTNPWIQPDFMFNETMAVKTSAESEDQTVTVVEEKQVGEYEVTILTATDAEDLVAYLEDNDYGYSDSDTAKMEYYVAQGGFYFVALKVDATFFKPTPMPVDDAAKVQALSIAPDDWFFGQLSPIEISFATDAPQLPMRTLKSNMPEMTFDLYMLGDNALFVPGIDTVYGNIVDAEFLSQTKSISGYDPKGRWLTRQEVRFDPSKSDADLYLAIADTNDFTVVDPGSQVRFDPSDLDAATGIIPGTRGQVVYTDGRTAFTFARSLTIGATGEDVRALQQLLNEEGFTVSETGAGAPGQESTYFGTRTKTALIRYQNFYRSDILEPIGLSAGTGYFGNATIDFIHR